MDMVSYKQAITSVEFLFNVIILSFAFHECLILLDSVSKLISTSSGLYLSAKLLVCVCIWIYVCETTLNSF